MRAPAIAAAALILAGSTAQAADAARGKITFSSQCTECHTAGAASRDSMGPNLFGVVGRKAGSKSGYTYSDAMKSSGIVWSDANIKRFIKDPSDVVPGTNMMFTGLSNPAEADNVVAYLDTLK